MQVTHRRVLARLYDPDHRLVVLKEHNTRLMWKNRVPQVKVGQATVPKAEVCSHHFSLRSGMADAALSLAHSGDRKACTRATNGQVVTCR